VGSAADAVVRAIEAVGGTAVASHDTVATPEGGKAIVDKALETFGTVDAVIHNAGVWRHKYYAEMTPDQLDPVLDVHLRGAFFVTQPAWSLMQAKGYGRIVLTSSSTGAFGRLAGTNYAAAKAAMLGLARALSLEGAEHGIKTNCILPVAPFRNRGPVPPELLEQLHSAGLAPEDAGPELVAPIVVYLASAACSVSGEAFSAGGRRFGRVFIGVADGWVSPGDAIPTAEDIEAHLPEIEDRSSYAIPPTSIDELRVIGELLRRR
jgi:NAD(P)-dependent dehydrogenase (short-subunit alcohol dehydrogenase family)